MKTKRLAVMAVLTAVALAVHALEGLIPPVVPLPGVRLGLANIITLFALRALGKKETLAVVVCRVLLGSLFGGSALSLAYSMAGALLCLAVMCPLLKITTPAQVWVVSVFGAMAHNLGQIAVAALILGSLSVLAYLPTLMVSGVLTGLFTGFCAKYLLKRWGELGL